MLHTKHVPQLFFNTPMVSLCDFVREAAKRKDDNGKSTFTVAKSTTFVCPLPEGFKFPKPIPNNMREVMLKKVLHKSIRLCLSTSFSNFVATGCATSSLNATFGPMCMSSRASNLGVSVMPCCPFVKGTKILLTKSGWRRRRSQYTASASVMCCQSTFTPALAASASTAPSGTSSMAISSMNWIVHSAPWSAILLFARSGT